MYRVLKIVFWILTAAVMILIFYFSSQVASESSELSDGIIFNLLSAFYPGFDNMNLEAQAMLAESLVFIVRKSAHFLIYTALGVFSMSAFCCYNLGMKKRFWFSAALCVSYSVSDEIHQLFVDGRSCEFRDVLIDSAGSALGILLVMLAVTLFSKRRKVME